MLTFDEFLEEQMKDPEFKKEYEALEPERELIESFIEAREAAGLTQVNLAKTTGITQSDISKLERGYANPTLKFLTRIADGLGAKLSIKFVPKTAM